MFIIAHTHVMLIRLAPYLSRHESSSRDRCVLPWNPTVFVRPREYADLHRSGRYDRKLVHRVSRETLRGTPCGPQRQVQIRFAPNCRWYLHRIVAWERHRWRFGVFPSVTHQARHADFHYQRSFWSKLVVVSRARHQEIHRRGRVVA